jgi:hypothetical protein
MKQKPNPKAEWAQNVAKMNEMGKGIPGIKPQMIDTTQHNDSYRAYKKSKKSVGSYVAKIRDSGGYGEYNFNRANAGKARAASTPSSSNIPGVKFIVPPPRVIPEGVPAKKPGLVSRISRSISSRQFGRRK